jgi:hypothetical protein
MGAGASGGSGDSRCVNRQIQGSTYGVVGLGRSDDHCLSRLVKGSEDTAEGCARVANQVPQAPDSKARAFPHLIRHLADQISEDLHSRQVAFAYVHAETVPQQRPPCRSAPSASRSGSGTVTEALQGLRSNGGPD